ncbi:MAG TPA: hypothetical protein VEB43_00885 [Anaeromyxobacter sp.]|nr:hypothetical protein [Anaeromyxobacter sp.]
MAESRDANDPGETMSGMRREALQEHDWEVQHDTGGQERASPGQRRGETLSPEEEEHAREIARTTAQQSDADALAVPRGDAVTGGSGNQTRGEAPIPDQG